MNQPIALPKLPGVKLDVTKEYVHITLETARLCLSSAVLGGGLGNVSHILNLHVSENFKGTKAEFEAPEITLGAYARSKGWVGESVGMMTSAYMNSFAHAALQTEDVILECYLTAGLSNARRAGDPADWRHFNDESPESGTINIILGTNAILTKAALVETLILVTEAKTALLTERNIMSPISGLPATGTGTDTVTVFCGEGRPIRYAGKHVLFGEMTANVVQDALAASLDRK